MRKLFLVGLFVLWAGYAHAQVVVDFTTAGAGTWTVPPNVTTVTGRVRGSGGGGDDAENAGDGGGACVQSITVTPGSTIYYTVGTHGSGSSSSPAGNGTTTWFNKTANSQPSSSSNGCYATGGKGSDGGVGGGFLGSSNFTGGQGATGPPYANAAGGGGADYLGNGGAASGGIQGSGGNPAGGAGGNLSHPTGNQPGGGGFAPLHGGTGSDGGDGKLTFVYTPTVFTHAFVPAVIP